MRPPGGAGERAAFDPAASGFAPDAAGTFETALWVLGALGLAILL